MRGALERVIRSADARRAEASEHCDLCGSPVQGQHRHLLDTTSRSVMCACQACSLLFVQDAASGGHYKLVPLRRLRLTEVPTTGLGVPVGLAFFVPQSDGTVTAHYPSPAGATQWDVDADAWRGVVERCEALRALEPEVEALLVNTVRGRSQHWVVPIDDCFRLVAVVRRTWQGLSGGSLVWPEVDRFFERLSERR